MKEFIKYNGKVVGAIVDDVFEKRINEAFHLFWKGGGVPCIDKPAWDSHKEKVSEIRIFTDENRIFSVSKEVFDQNKQTINFGYGDQYMLPKEFWRITDTQMKLFK